MLSPGLDMTVPESSFSPRAVHTIQPDLPGALAKPSGAGRLHSPPAAQLAANNISVGRVPGVVADRAPLALVVDLHSPCTAPSPVHQPDPPAPCSGEKPQPSEAACLSAAVPVRCAVLLTPAHSPHVKRSHANDNKKAFPVPPLPAAAVSMGTGMGKARTRQ